MNQRILFSVLVIGVVGALATGSTFALFNDTETSENNTFTAGALDLKVDYTEYYNGEFQDSSKLTDNPSTIFNLSDIKPGDQGAMALSLHLNDNPGYIWMRLNQTVDADNSCTEPEQEAEPECTPEGEGELDDEMNVTIFYDDGDGVQQQDEEVIYEGSVADMPEEGMLLDGEPQNNGTQPFDPEPTYYVGFNWELPRDTGNEVQTDSFAHDLELYTEQARHNDNPDNPFA